MLYQTISTLQFHFSNGFGNKRNLVCSQMNRKNIITIRISFKRHMSIYIFKKKCCYFSCIEAHNHQTSGLTTSGFRDKMKIYRPSRRLFTLYIVTDYFITSFFFKLLHFFSLIFFPFFIFTILRMRMSICIRMLRGFRYSIHISKQTYVIHTNTQPYTYFLDGCVCV